MSVANIKAYSFRTFLNFTENSLLEQSDTIRIAFTGYAVLAFASTLFREIVKDLEDAQGDAALNCRTLPVVLGVSQGRNVAFLVGLFFLFLVFFFSWILRGSFLKILILNITISLPIVYVLFSLWRAEEKTDFARVSKLAKLIMLSGLIFILIMKL
ncbi:MAG: UbiA family prenyltransferase [Saprospiraceae bacterium]|nr:UbiA family prenyltransferase [Saprospiraceae bacterium]